MREYFKIVAVAIAFIMISVFVPVGFNHIDGPKGNVCFAGGFWMEQVTGAEQGTIEGHLDISSPWSGGYVYENFTAVGRIEINDSFSMNNLGPGVKSGFDQRANFNPAVVKSASETAAGKISEKENDFVSALDSVLGISIISVPSWFDLF